MRSDRPNMDQPRIETARLILCLPRIEDFDGYAELHADEEAARHIGGALPRAAAWRKFLQMPGAWRDVEGAFTKHRHDVYVLRSPLDPDDATVEQVGKRRIDDQNQTGTTNSIRRTYCRHLGTALDILGSREPIPRSDGRVRLTGAFFG